MVRAIKNRTARIVALIVASVLTLLIVLGAGMAMRQGWRPWRPSYEKADIAPLLDKEELSAEDYALLYRQTGLGRLGIDGLRAAGMRRRILDIQAQFFAEQEIEPNVFAPYAFYLKRSDGESAYAVLENGDILYSPSTFFSFARLGHSALVVDSSWSVIAQASGYGNPVKLISASNVFSRPAYVILRVNADEETRRAVADYVADELMGVKYRLLAGVFTSKAPEELTSTQCAHVIWYSYYKKAGLDIDGDGGKIVTPGDILISDLVSVVQVYGVDIYSYGLAERAG